MIEDKRRTKRKNEIIDGVLHLECRECKLFLPYTSFHRTQSNYFGRVIRCISCVKEYKKRLEQSEVTEESKEFLDNLCEVLSYDKDNNISEEFKKKIEKKYGVKLP